MAEQRVMLRSVLESIQNLQQSVSSLVRSSKRSSNADVAELPEDVTFPLKTVDDVCNLNERLVHTYTGCPKIMYTLFESL